MAMTRTFSELSRLETYEERYEYLKLSGAVGRETFGHERWLNQHFYQSREWKQIRYHVIARDLGCDLGVPGYEIPTKLQVHHMNPINRFDLIDFNSDVLEPEFLITVSHETHNAIHYGADAPRRPLIVERRPGDTKLW